MESRLIVLDTAARCKGNDRNILEPCRNEGMLDQTEIV